MGTNGNGECDGNSCFFILSSLFSPAINFPALTSLLQMFSNNMNLNANKLPILVPSTASSNITSTSHHGSNQSLNIPEQQQQQPLNSPRSTLTTNSNNADSSLLICGPTASGLAHSNPPFAPPLPLYGNSATTLANPGAGREDFLRANIVFNFSI